MDKTNSTLREELIQNVNLLPASAEVWVDEHLKLLKDNEFDSAFIKESLIGFLNESRSSELRAVLEFLLPIFDIEKFNPEMMFHQFEPESEPVPQYCKIDPGYLRLIMGAFPNIWGTLNNDQSELLKVSQVARMLRISESKVRKLALADELEFTRSQGETGHYRFHLDQVKKYVERNGGPDHD